MSTRATDEMPANHSRRKILLYGDVNLNILDGSAVWLVSMAEALSQTRSEVWVLLKAAEIQDRLSKHLHDLRGVHVVPHADDAHSAELSPRLGAHRIAILNNKHNFDVIISRGFRVAEAIATSATLLKRSWIYITDLPFPATAVSEKQLASLNAISKGARRLFAQTEDARSYLEGLVPYSAGKTLALPPMIPDEYFDEESIMENNPERLKLVYSGKFAKGWRTLEMCSIVPELRNEGIEAELTMIGDKFQADRADPTWPERMQAAVVQEDVNWVGGRSRDEAIGLVRTNHLGLGWRVSELDSSLELSTKVLEYAASGVPPVLNRTAAHEELFGKDYPFFVAGDGFDDLLSTLKKAGPALSTAQAQARSAAAAFSMSAAAQRLESAFTRAEGCSPRADPGTRTLRVVVAGHDLKFSGELLEMLANRPDVELRIDRWRSLHEHDENASVEMLEWADVVICEWAGPNSVWYSTRKRPGQRLIVRLHAFELRGPWLHNVAVDNVDCLVCVSVYYGQLARENMAIGIEKIRIIPNSLDMHDLSRPKKAGARYRIGLVGMVPFIKRPDRALDVLESLLRHDDRYTLHIKGRMPWEYPYEWNKPLQREAYLNFFARVGASPDLVQRVVFEPFAADIGSWLRKIGYILSPSTEESFHLAPAEGMASGAVPVFWKRPGVSGIFGDDFLIGNSEEAALLIRRLSHNIEDFESAVRSARATAAQFDVEACSRQWLDVISESDNIEQPGSTLLIRETLQRSTAREK